MARKPKPLPDPLVALTVRLSPMLVKRAKLAATLLDLPVQTVVSLALHDWLREHERKDQPSLLGAYIEGQKLAAQGGKKAKP